MLDPYDEEIENLRKAVEAEAAGKKTPEAPYILRSALERRRVETTWRRKDCPGDDFPVHLGRDGRTPLFKWVCYSTVVLALAATALAWIWAGRE